MEQSPPPIVRTIGHAQVGVHANAEQLVEAAASAFAKLAHTAVRQRGVFRVALAGGTTPRALYERLAALGGDGPPWERVEVYFGDERHVGPDDPQSNFRMSKEALLSKVSIPQRQVFRIEAELPGTEAAGRYQQRLRENFALPAGAFPRFDLVLLGLGADGHTASLFPGTSALHETVRLVVAHSVPKLGADRLTLTPPTLNAAATIWFIVTGVAKAGAVRDVLTGPIDPVRLPAQSIRPSRGELLWWVDAEAASEVPSLQS